MGWGWWASELTDHVADIAPGPTSVSKRRPVKVDLHYGSQGKARNFGTSLVNSESSRILKWKQSKRRDPQMTRDSAKSAKAHPVIGWHPCSRHAHIAMDECECKHPLSS
jgi:hypothetical protein